MTTATPPAAPRPAATPPAATRPVTPQRIAVREAWRVTPSAVVLVAGLELRQRVRSTKWKWSLAAVAALIGGVTVLIFAATHAFGGEGSGQGDVLFSTVVFFVLFLGLVVSPTLSATTINGDVRDGTMAPLQSTGLSAADIVLGKLLASWAASLAFLAVAVPFMIFGYFDGSLPALAMLQVVLVLAAELLVVCALGIGWSALTARTPASAVLTYVTVAVLTAVLPIVFGLTAAVFTTETTVTQVSQEYVDPTYLDLDNLPEGVVADGYGYHYRCTEYTYVSDQPRTDALWWMLAVNPYVIVADSSPAPADIEDDMYGTYVLGGLKQVVREARLGPSAYQDFCDASLSAEEQARNNERDSLPPVWPWGLGIQALMAAGAVALGVRRLTVPYGTLPAGSRVA